MAKYLILKHYRGGPTPYVAFEPLDRWAPDKVDAHMKYMHDFAAKLQETGEFVDGQALSPEQRLYPAHRRDLLQLPGWLSL